MQKNCSLAQLATAVSAVVLLVSNSLPPACAEGPVAPAARPAGAYSPTAGDLIVGNGQDMIIDVGNSAQTTGRAGLVVIPGDLKVLPGSTLYAVSTNAAVTQAVV